MSDTPPPSLRFFLAGSSDEFEIPFGEGNFPPLKFPHPSQAFVMAVVNYRDKKVRALGTCFSISNRGLVVTARHVVEEVARIHASAADESDEFCGVLCVCPEPTPELPLNFDLGMSGGPIISATSQGVCGVICSGTEMADPTIPRISYGSLIGPALAIPLEMTSKGVTKRFFLWDLVRGGAVFCDATYARIAVKREANSIEINFGGGRIIRNRLG